MSKKTRTIIFTIISLLILITLILNLSYESQTKLLITYKNQESVILQDRNSEIISIKPNKSKYYNIHTDQIPEDFKNYLLQKEDKYFYYHPGINPGSTIRALFNYIRRNKNLASSTITQQLVKILLQNENKRTIKNKLIEAYYSLALEIFQSKEEILKMYINSVFLGNQVQGLNLASKLYFNVTPELLTKNEIIQILASLNSPSNNNPFISNNIKKSLQLQKQLQLKNLNFEEKSLAAIQKRKKSFKNFLKSTTDFEIETLDINNNNYNLTIDKNLTENIREISKQNISILQNKNAKNTATIVIKYPENELLAMIGSQNPEIQNNGSQINMAIQNRPIGSTIKPFIYLKGFEKELRPYTLVDDKEYKYLIENGFSFYPKNYDYKYRGIVNLQYALSNSLNVPTVKVLEHTGLENFYNFLLNDLEIKPVQNLENYQLGIALGQLEMDLLSLSHYFSIFTHKGNLRPLNICTNCNSLINKKYNLNKKIAENRHIQLVNKIITDRKTGIEQFGLKSEFNTFQENIAIKTGTSREYHDSWIVGFTPDFLIATWVGNANNTPMDKISGQSGAGKIWHEVMNLMLNSKYNKKTNFEFNLIEEFYNENTIDYGLKNDEYIYQKNLLLEENLILSPHNQDIFLFEKNTKIPLKARTKVKWFINNKFISEDKEIIFRPKERGQFKIKAIGLEEEQIIITIEK